LLPPAEGGWRGVRAPVHAGAPVPGPSAGAREPRHPPAPAAPPRCDSAPAVPGTPTDASAPIEAAHAGGRRRRRRPEPSPLTATRDGTPEPPAGYAGTGAAKRPWSPERPTPGAWRPAGPWTGPLRCTRASRSVDRRAGVSGGKGKRRARTGDERVPGCGRGPARRFPGPTARAQTPMRERPTRGVIDTPAAPGSRRTRAGSAVPARTVAGPHNHDRFAPMRPFQITRSGVAGTLLALAAAATCVRLGIWQLDRLEQRRTRNAAVSERIAAEPVTLTSIRPDTTGMIFRTVTVEGEFDHD